MTTSITLKSDNLHLEALLTPGSSMQAAVIAHPHTLYGGDMHSPVVAAVALAYEDSGWTTLRFNFRGAGSSQGRFDDGAGEQRDLQAAITHFQARGFDRVDLAGYSFGAWVIAHWSQSHPDNRHRIHLVAPPVAFMDFTQIGAIPGLHAVFAGSCDTFGPPERIQSELKRWQSFAGLHLIQGADHFFTGQIDQLKRALAEAI